MEKASEAKRTKASRLYDGMAEFSEKHKQLAAKLLATAGPLERGQMPPVWARNPSLVKRRGSIGVNSSLT